MKFILGKKLNMTQIFQPDGMLAPVTAVQAGPCAVVQVKNIEKDGYLAVQFGYGEKNKKNIAKPQQGHYKESGNFKYLREMRLPPDGKIDIKAGQLVDVTSFEEGDIISITGISKGRGFQGVVKRHHFHGAPASHGHKDQLRHSGSVGPKGPAHVFKGTRMGGQMGDEQITIKNLEIIKVDAENNILYIKGAVPGARNGLIIIKGEGELKVTESKKLEVTRPTAHSGAYALSGADAGSEKKEREKIFNDELKMTNENKEEIEKLSNDEARMTNEENKKITDEESESSADEAKK